MEKKNGTTTASECQSVHSKKRTGAMSLFRAIRLAVSSGSSKKTHLRTNAIVDANTVKTLVGGVRPLHHRLNYCPAPPPPPPNNVLDAYYDVNMPPPSPCESAGTSRYASAVDLQSLDTSEDSEEEAGSNGDQSAINMRADEFIAKFYEQMRLQQADSFKRRVEEATVEESVEPLEVIEEKAMVEESEESNMTIEVKIAAEKSPVMFI